MATIKAYRQYAENINSDSTTPPRTRVIKEGENKRKINTFPALRSKFKTLLVGTVFLNVLFVNRLL